MREIVRFELLEIRPKRYRSDEETLKMATHDSAKQDVLPEKFGRQDSLPRYCRSF
ncbi:MAG TPA: hypothetical protein VN328_01740 [Thermodesulfovibrionales bacterium]|nr:hypothetical protein [Thermodesulfovibrionales bacterium]